MKNKQQRSRSQQCIFLEERSKCHDYLGGYKQENVRKKGLTRGNQQLTMRKMRSKCARRYVSFKNQTCHLLHRSSIMRAFLFLVIVAVASAFTSPLMMKRKLQICIYEKVISSIFKFFSC